MGPCWSPDDSQHDGGDGSATNEPAGCAHPRWWLRFRTPSGDLLPVPCRSPNRCDFCRFMATLEYSTMVLQDALGPRPPRVGLTLTTSKPSTDPADFRHGVKQVRALLRSELGPLEDCGHIEFTTGRGKRSGGHRRIHQHSLVKLPDDVPVAQALGLEERIGQVWERHTGAHRVELAELRTAAGAAHYLTHHHSKSAQLPPRGWSGRRFRPTRGYFDRPAPERRQLARAQLLDHRLRRAVLANMNADESLDVLDDETWNGEVAGRLATATAAVEDVELVRVQRVPSDFDADGLPSAWTVEVLGPAVEP